MRKIYIINQYYHPFFAATGQLLKELAEYLVEKGYKVNIITGTNGNKDLKEEEKLNGVYIYRIKNFKDGISYKKKFVSYLGFYWSLFWFLLFKTEKDSIILSLSTPPLISFIPIILKKIKKYKILYNIQDLYPDILVKMNPEKRKSLIYKFSKKIAQKILDKADKVIVIGDCMKKNLIKEYEINEYKISVIENWALKEIEEYNFKEIKNEKLKVLYSGNMGRGHEHETILKTIKNLEKNNIRNIEFNFVGGGYNYNLLKEKIQHIEFVNFSNYVEREELPRTLNEADICLVIGSKELSGIIVPSKFYGIAAAGNPVIYISSGEDTISYHIRKGGLGYKVDNYDYKQLYNKLIDLLKDKSKTHEISENVKYYYNKFLKREKPLRKYEKLLKELGENK